MRGRGQMVDVIMKLDRNHHSLSLCNIQCEIFCLKLASFKSNTELYFYEDCLDVRLLQTDVFPVGLHGLFCRHKDLEDALWKEWS